MQTIILDEATASVDPENEQKLVSQYGAFKDYYHDDITMGVLKKLPLALQKRPEWDKSICEKIGYQNIEITLLDVNEYWNPFLTLRYRMMPTFVLKAEKPK